MTTISKRSWRDNPIMWVIGCINAQGEITGRPSFEGHTHRPREREGHPWLWSVWEQEFREVLGGTGCVTPEEHYAICDWLIRQGYADDRCLPTPTPGDGFVRCFYCGTLFPKDKITRDHFIARSKQGRGPGNRVPACVRCNKKKGNRGPTLAEIERFHGQGFAPKH